MIAQSNKLMLMHDTSSKLITIKRCISLLREGTINKEDTEMLLTAIEKKADELTTILDNLYSKNVDINY